VNVHVLDDAAVGRLVLALAGVGPAPVGAEHSAGDRFEDEEGVPLATLAADGTLAATSAGSVRAAQVSSVRRDLPALWIDGPPGPAVLATVTGRARTAGSPLVQVLVPIRAGGRWSVGARRSLAGAAAASLLRIGVEAVVDELPVPSGLDDPETAPILRALGVEPVAASGGATDPDGEDPDVAAAVVRHRREPGRQGVVVLLTGLSGSGKSTIAGVVAGVVAVSRTVTLLDGDRVRRLLSAGLGFSREDRDLNVTRIGWVAAEIGRHGGVAVCAPIAPYAATRERIRAMTAEADAAFVLVHVATPLAECERRDRKGLYARARAGEIPAFTGISDPYDEPTDADLVIDTTNRTVADCAEETLGLLRRRGFLPEPAR